MKNTSYRQTFTFTFQSFNPSIFQPPLDILRDILPLKNQMYRLALRITLSSQEAEDVVQDVIIRLWKMDDRLEDLDNLEAYAMRMTRNLAIDRQRMPVNQTEDIDPAMVVSHEEPTMEHDDRLDIIRQYMAQLPEKQRTAMQLRDFEGMSYREIADIMHISEDQVKVSIHRARQFIKSRVCQ